jgi:hypothetical protein
LSDFGLRILVMFGVGVAALLGVALLAVFSGVSAGDSQPGVLAGSMTEQPSRLARREIPASYLRLYTAAAAAYGLDWAVLAGIGRVECDHGQDPDPACGEAGAVNGSGAGGPMQFIASTWAEYGVDGDRDGRVDRWDPADAIYSAAHFLRSAGAPGNYFAAIFAYNHADWYVRDVERWAARYRGPAASAGGLASQSPGGSLLAGASPTAIRTISGSTAVLAPGDGHLALIPEDAPAVVQAMVIAGNELQGLRYGPGGHPDPLGASEEDCSSTVNYVLYRSGVRSLAEIVARNPLAQDYVGWGLPGPGRWVTIYATDLPTPHVFIVVARLRLDTSHDGTDVGPNRNQDGPRWRILDRIPTWAHWSIRHPPGL